MPTRCKTRNPDRLSTIMPSCTQGPMTNHRPWTTLYDHVVPVPERIRFLPRHAFPILRKKTRLFCSLMKIESWFKLDEAAWLERVWTFLQYRWIILKLRCGFVKVTRKISFRQFSNLQNFNSYCLLESRSPQSPASNKMAAFVGAHAITCGSTFVEYCTN